MRCSVICVWISGLLLASILGAQVTQPQSTPTAAPARRVAPTGGGAVRGTVKDGTGGVIPGAKVTLTDANNGTQTVNSGADGSYVFRGVPSGVYSVTATYTGLQQQTPLAVSVVAGQPATANIVMNVQTQKQEINVTDTNTNTVSTEAANNASALVSEAGRSGCPARRSRRFAGRSDCSRRTIGGTRWKSDLY